MKLSTKIGICLVMGGGTMYDQELKWVMQYWLYARAGLAAINKTIAIASITDISDLTYVIYKLNTWTLTEMWFIIIFGSIPTLRVFFMKFLQDIKTAASFSSRNSRPRSNTALCIEDVNEQRESRIHLDNRLPNPWSTQYSTTSASCDARPGQHRPDLEANQRQIMVTKNTTIISEQG